MASNTYSFTPVRRRMAEFEDDDFDAAPKHWTAARCNRLLRSLKSRVELLKKDAAQFTTTSRPAESPNTGTPLHNTGKRNNDALCNNYRGEDGLKPRKRVRVTYAGRSRPKAEPGRSPNNHGTKSKSLKNAIPAITRPPGEVSVETPVLIRSRFQDSIPQTSLVKNNGLGDQLKTEDRKIKYPHCVNVSRISTFRSDTSLKLLQPAINSKRYALYMGIYNALEALLKSTEQVFTQAPERSDSLFSLCLRNVHQRIQLEEEWEAIDADRERRKPTLEKQDISGEIYNELEDLGTSEFGWKHLRTVVRAHGVQIVADAIASGLINQIFGEALIMLCSYTGSFREAETLLDALLLTLPNTGPATPYSRLADIGNFAPLTVLEKYVKYTGRVPEYFRIMRGLFRRKIISIHWLATKELGGLWARLFHAISIVPPCKNATEFLQEVLPQMLNASAGQSKGDVLPHNTRLSVAIGTTFSSVLATLSAVVILDEIMVSKESDTLVSTDRGRNVITTLRHLHVDYSIPPAEHRGQVSLVFLANLLAMPLSDAGASRCDQLIKLLQQTCESSHTVIDPEITEFMCSVARCCGRGLSDSGLEYFKRFSLFIDSCLSSGNGPNRHLLPNIIVSSAYLFSQQVPIPAHLDYADDIRIKFQTHPPLSQGKSPKIKPTIAFRWEEGISEWVEPTPIKPMKQTQDDHNPFRWHNSEVDSPVPPYRRSHKNEVPSYPTHLENGLGLGVSGRVSDLIPSSPSGYGSDALGYDDGDVVFSSASPPMRLASILGRGGTAPHNVVKNMKYGDVGPGSTRNSRDWCVQGEAANVTVMQDTDEEDELSAPCILPECKLSVMTEVESNKRLRVNGQSQIEITGYRKSAASVFTEEDIDFSGDELSF